MPSALAGSRITLHASEKTSASQNTWFMMTRVVLPSTGCAVRRGVIPGAEEWLCLSGSCALLSPLWGGDRPLGELDGGDGNGDWFGDGYICDF